MGKRIKPINRPNRGWRAKPFNVTAAHGWKDTPTRQSKRALARKTVWQNWRCYVDSRSGIIDTAPRDDRGVMRRRTRRLISRVLAKKAFKEASK